MVIIKKATRELLNSHYLKIFLFDPVLIEALLDKQLEGDIINCIVENNNAVGYCIYTKHDDNNQLIIGINQEFTRKGYGFSLAKQTIEEAFKVSKVNVIRIKTLIERPSNKLAYKLGFVETKRDAKEIFYELKLKEFSLN